MDQLANLITSKIRAVVLVNPADPTGNIFARDDLLRWGEVLKDNGLLLLIDDPYSDLIYENMDNYFNLVG